MENGREAFVNMIGAGVAIMIGAGIAFGKADGLCFCIIYFWGVSLYSRQLSNILKCFCCLL
jgi:hypothetical protein